MLKWIICYPQSETENAETAVEKCRQLGLESCECLFIPMPLLFEETEFQGTELTLDAWCKQRQNLPENKASQTQKPNQSTGLISRLGYVFKMFLNEMTK